MKSHALQSNKGTNNHSQIILCSKLTFHSLISDSPRNNVVMAPCLSDDGYNEKWEITPNNQLRQVNLNLCLDIGNLNPQDHIYATECDDKKDSQKWILQQ